MGCTHHRDMQKWLVVEASQECLHIGSTSHPKYAFAGRSILGRIKQHGKPAAGLGGIWILVGGSSGTAASTQGVEQRTTYGR